jgi:hypothetical protein
MKRSVTVVLVLAPLALAASEREPDTAWVEPSRELAARFGAELKDELSRAIAAGGPVAAIDVCHSRAPQVAARLSQESGATVSRTALRVRNPANAPDDMQRRVLEGFRAELASGKAPAPLEAVFEIRRGDGIERRYMRAIPTEALCLTCHGKTLSPDVAAAIARDYPDDEATGFEQGELRGAISVIWPASLPPSP